MTDTFVDAAAAQQGLQRLGLSGRPICLHSSLRSFGHIEGGADAIVEACLAEGCTVLVPTFSWVAFAVRTRRASTTTKGTDYSWRPVPSRSGPYTPASRDLDVDEMGAVPAAVLDRPDHVRGDHPLCSFTAVGPSAAPLVATQTWADVYAPLRELVGYRGSVLLVGVDLTVMTLLHLAESMAGRVPFQRWALGRDGQVRGVTVGGCSYGFTQLRQSLEPCRTSTRVGSSHWDAYDAMSALTAARTAIQENAECTVCADRCERCTDARDGGPVVPS